MEIIQPTLTSYQKAILFSPARFTICEAGTKIGKTYSHIIWLYGMAHSEEDMSGKNFWWVAPVYNQAKIAFTRLRRYLVLTGLYQFNESALYIDCPNGARITFKSAEKPDNLYGEDVYGAVFDEAPRARPEAWYALRSTLSSTGAPCKLIGNFGGISNWVHQLKEKAKTDSEYEYFKVTCWDAVAEGILQEDEVLQAKRDLPEKIFKELYEAEASESDGQLITNHAISNLFKIGLLPGKNVNHYITADIARLGKDKTVILVWEDLKIIEIQVIDVSTVDESVDVIKQLQAVYGVKTNNIIVDEDGVGGGVKDYLKCVGFVNNSKPIKVSGKVENFSNIKSQCYYKLAESINSNLIEIYCDAITKRLIIEELEWVRLANNNDVSKISFISKDLIKKGIGRSPDYADAIMMRMHFNLNPNKGKYSIY